MRAQGRAGRAIERAELMSYLRQCADEWRAGVPRDRSIQGHHMPLKHVYRWLARIDEAGHDGGGPALPGDSDDE